MGRGPEPETGDGISANLLELVTRCRNGDADAWRTLLPAFQEVGRRTLRSFHLSVADIDDVLAEALTGLYAGGLSQFRGGTTAELVGFLRSVVRNQAIDFVKSRNRWFVTEPAGLEKIGAGLDRPVDDPFTVNLENDQCVEFLRSELETLPVEDRELFLMKARGLKEREIAVQTGRPPGTVASRISRLLERLRSALRERGCV